MSSYKIEVYVCVSERERERESTEKQEKGFDSFKVKPTSFFFSQFKQLPHQDRIKAVSLIVSTTYQTVSKIGNIF